MLSKALVITLIVLSARTSLAWATVLITRRSSSILMSKLCTSRSITVGRLLVYQAATQGVHRWE